jgi:DNA polymerase-3 subunit alpha
MGFGTLSVEELVAEGVRCGATRMVLADIHNTSCFFDFAKACGVQGIQAIPGISFHRSGRLAYVGIAQNATGFRELNEYLSKLNLASEEPPPLAPLLNHVFFVYPLHGTPGTFRSEREFVGVQPSDALKLRSHPASKQPGRLVVLNTVTHKDKKGYNIHRLLRAVHANTLLSKLDPACCSRPDDRMLDCYELMAAFHASPHVVRNTDALLDQCSFDMDLKAFKNKRSFTGSLYEDMLLLEQEAWRGFRYRYPKGNAEAEERVRKELGIIHRLGFNAYFLITWDVIRFARKHQFAYVGRGSGANSIVAYCLQITDADPMELDLYFERFLNPHRTSPPDFDVDFSWNERDRVIQHIFDTHGTKYVALLAAYNTYQGRSIVRELGKVFGLPKHEIDQLASGKQPLKGQARDEVTSLILRYGPLIEHFPHHLSIHAGGVLISEAPINSYTAVDLPPKGFPITHFDMMVAEDIGLHKYDILSQRGLGHIRDAVTLVQQNRGETIDIHATDTLKQDARIRTLIREGRTIGCFYVESPAMRMLLKKLRCEDYLTLVAASSIIRPGVARSGMMKAYIERFNNPQKIKYLHPKMEELLRETYGVMVYQEDVIKVAHHFAGLDLAEADVLRRAMSGKYRSRKEFQKIVDRFFENCRQRGYEESVSREVWRQIESFSGYSFSKAHSASFAIESYQSLFLKAYYPLEFMTAVINNFGGFYRTEFYVHEARMDGADIQAPCVNEGRYLTHLVGRTMYLGFIHMKSLEHDVAVCIEQERQQRGHFTGLENFVRRMGITLEQLNLLIQVGALRFTGKTKRQLYWEAIGIFGHEKRKPGPGLFVQEEPTFVLPDMPHSALEHARDELELLGFALCHPFDLLPPQPDMGICQSVLMQHLGKEVTMIGYLVTTKDVRTVKGEPMLFGTFLDYEGRFFDTTHFPPCLAHYPIRGRGFYRIVGLVVQEFGYPSIEVIELEKLPMRQPIPLHLPDVQQEMALVGM